MSVAAFGALNIDIIYSGVDRLPNPGEEIYYPHFDIQLGGGPVLMPVMMKHFGIKARLGTFLSDDFQSHMATRLLDGLGFKNYRNFYLKKGGSPVIVTSAISLKRDRCFASYCADRTGGRPSADQVYKFLHGSKVCYASQQHPAAMRKLRAEGTIVVYDSGWEDDMHISDHAGILKNVDIYTPNDKEAMKLTRTRSPEAALRSLARYVKCPIIKTGKRGCMSLCEDKIIRVGMPCRFEVMDTTGAGDNFLAGIVYGLCQDWKIIDCMKMGNIFGGISTTRLGCYRGVLAIKETDLMRYMRLY